MLSLVFQSYMKRYTAISIHFEVKKLNAKPGSLSTKYNAILITVKSLFQYETNK